MLFLFVLALPIFLFFVLPKYRKNGEMLHPPLGPPPPGPPRLPFLGNFHQIDNSSPHLCLWQLSKTYGPLMSLQLGTVPALVVSSAKMAKEIMKTHDLTFSGRPTSYGPQKLSYNASDLVFSPYNESWREKRKICTLNLFSSKRVQSFRPIREDEVCRMIKKISEQASSSKLTNLSEIVMSLSCSIICRVAFGKSYDDEGYESSRFHGLFYEVQAVASSFFISDYFPLFGWVDKLTGLHARLEKIFKQTDIFYQELINDHLGPNRAKSMQEDIIDILLQLKKDQLSSIDLSFDDIKAIVMNILVAGTDTVAATLVWVLTGLMRNPRVMKKVQEEVRKLIGEKGKVDEDDIEKLPYLKAVVKESMRIYPTGPLLVPRATTQKCIIDGYEIQSKTVVYVNAWAIGRDKEYWENPEEFLPERFVGTTIDFKGKDFEFIPFGAGRRVCPGINLASTTVELALANLLYSFDWKLPAGMKNDDVDTEVMPGFAAHKKNALCLIAKPFVC